MTDLHTIIYLHFQGPQYAVFYPHTQTIKRIIDQIIEELEDLE